MPRRIPECLFWQRTGEVTLTRVIFVFPVTCCQILWKVVGEIFFLLLFSFLGKVGRIDFISFIIFLGGNIFRVGRHLSIFLVIFVDSAAAM